MKNKYKISMYYDDYLLHYENIVGVNLNQESNSIIFYTNKESIKYLNDNGVCFINEGSTKETFKNIITHKKIFLISFIILSFILYMNMYRIQEVKFNVETPINEKIEKSITQTYKKVFFFTFSNLDYEQFSRNLRSTYTEYEWISVDKKYDVIEVDIIKSGFSNVSNDVSNGDIIATKDGVISSYLAHSGTPLIEVNQYVKANDVLILGSYEEQLTQAKGYVLAETFVEETYTVNKVIEEEAFTGNSKSFYGLNLFGFNIKFSKNNFVSSKVEEKTIFKIPYILSIKNYQVLEKNVIMYNNDLETASDYAKSLVDKNFEKNKVLTEEKILDKKVLVSKEFDDRFEFVLLVKKLESIGKFKGV